MKASLMVPGGRGNPSGASAGVVVKNACQVLNCP
jgi:hypothetical protein